MSTVPPTSLDRIVLMRPGAVTHHSCMDQRYVSLELDLPLDPDPNWRGFKAPPVSRTLAPRGYYMLFLVNNHGVPSQAKWVKLK
jgi:Galactose oxidase-like, Early set domain